VSRGNTDVFGETARVNIGGFERSAHGVVAVAAVVAISAGDVMSDNDTLTNGEVGDMLSSFDNGSG